jgi:hypothetical protein
MIKHIKTVDEQILSRIYGNKRGWVFTPDYFKHLGTRDSIASALKRHKQSGLIRQLARGLYDYPKIDPELGALEPSAETIAKTLAGRDATRLQPSGAYAANLLGLSTQVPMKIIYLTDGRSRTVQLGKRQIILKNTTPRSMATANKISGLVIQALRYLGKDNITQEEIAKLKMRLSPTERKQLITDIRYAPEWVAEIFRELA